MRGGKVERVRFGANRFGRYTLRGSEDYVSLSACDWTIPPVSFNHRTVASRHLRAAVVAGCGGGDDCAVQELRAQGRGRGRTERGGAGGGGGRDWRKGMARASGRARTALCTAYH